MRTPKGMIKVFLTNEELQRLIADYSARIDEIDKAMEALPQNVRIALTGTIGQMKERRAVLESMNTPSPRKPGRPRKFRDGLPQDKSESDRIARINADGKPISKTAP